AAEENESGNDRDGVEILNFALGARLEDGEDALHGSRQGEGEHLGGHRQGGVEEDNGQGQQRGDQRPDGRDEVEQKGDEAEGEGEIDADHGQAQADEDARGDGEAGHLEDVALDTVFDLAQQRVGRPQTGLAADEEEDHEDEYQPAAGGNVGG